MEPATMAEPRQQSPGSVDRPAPPGPVYGDRDDLLRGPTLKHRDVYIERLGKTFRIRELRVAEFQEVSKQMKDPATGESNTQGFAARMIAVALVYPDGRQVFPEPHKDFAQLIESLTPDIITQLWEAGDEMWLLSEEAKKAAGKSSVGTPVASP